MSFEQAKQMALKANPNVDTVAEYQEFWVFYSENKPEQDSEVCIEKASGERVSFAELVMDGRIEEIYKEQRLN